MKFRYRILLSYLVVILSYCLFYSIWVVRELRPRYLETIEDVLNETAHSYANLLSHQSDKGKLDIASIKNAFGDLPSRELNAQIFDVKKKTANLSIYVTDAKGIVLYDSKNSNTIGLDFSSWNDVYLCLKGEYGVRTTFETPGDLYTADLYVAAPVYFKDKIIACVSVSKPVSSVRPYLDVARNKMVFVALVGAVMALVFSFSILAWILIPLKKLMTYSRSMKGGEGEPSGEKDEKYRIKGDEISYIKNKMDDVAIALDSKLYVESCLQSLVHELKSPVTAIQGAAEILEGPIDEKDKNRFAQNIKVEASRTQNIIEKFLALASLEVKKDEVPKQNEFFRSIIEDVISEFRSRYETFDIIIKPEIDQNVKLSVNRFLMHQLFSNLFQNAYDFSQEIKKIEISSILKEGQLIVTLRDFGVGIPGYGVPKLYDRFFSLKRPESGKKGTGLGLSFVKEVVEIHKGSIHIDNHSNGGVLVIVSMPI